MKAARLLALQKQIVLEILMLLEFSDTKCDLKFKTPAISARLQHSLWWPDWYQFKKKKEQQETCSSMSKVK